MATPKGIKCVYHQITEADKILIYSDQHQIILQLRHEVPSEVSIVEPAYKTAVPLMVAHAIAIAGDLLSAAQHQMQQDVVTIPKPPPGKQQKKKKQVSGASNHNQA